SQRMRRGRTRQRMRGGVLASATYAVQMRQLNANLLDKVLAASLPTRATRSTTARQDVKERRATALVAALLNALLAVLVVHLALRLVLEHVVHLLQLFEQLRLVRIAVRMVLQGDVSGGVFFFVQM